MPNYFYPQDVYPIMNQLVSQISGQTSVAVTDTTSFVSAGTSVLEAGYENVLNAISVLISRTIVAARPYSGKFKLINAENDAFDNRARKISFYSHYLLFFIDTFRFFCSFTSRHYFTAWKS